MNGQRLAGMLGLAMRARQAAAGMDACRIMIRSGKCGVILADGEAGPNTVKKAEDLARQAGIPFSILPSGMIMKATGKSNMVIAVREGSFAEQIISMLSDQEPVSAPR